MRNIKTYLLVIISLSIIGCSQKTESPEFKGFPLVSYGKGFFTEERNKDLSWRWMATEGFALVRNIKKDMTLKISGIVPARGMPAAPTMQVYFNGKQLDQFLPPKGLFEKSYRFPVSKQGNDEWCELRLTVDQAFIPNKVDEASKDARRLGFKLHQLTWDEDGK